MKKSRRLIPDYLRGKYQLLGTVVFTAFFSLVFMLVSIPFSHNAWFALGTSSAFGYTATFFFLSLLVVVVSKRVLYMTRNHPMTFFQYVIWDLLEAVTIAILYALLSRWGNSRGIISLAPESTFITLSLSAMVYCFVSLVIPYIIAGMFFAIVERDNTIRLMNANDVVSDDPPEEKHEAEKIALYDNNGSLKLSVSLSHLFYIESSDNYVIVWYSDSSDQLKKYMIRCRLKTIEESFRGSSLVRCHRKYIVNMDKVQSLRREKDGYELDLEDQSIPSIPITKTYAENVLSRFNSRK